MSPIKHKQGKIKTQNVKIAKAEPRWCHQRIPESMWTTLPNLNKFVGLVRLGRVVLCLKALQHKPFGAIYFKSKMRHKNSNRSNFDYKQSNFRNLNPSVSCHKLLTEIHQPLVKPNKIFMSSSWTTPPFDMASCFSASYVDALCYKTQCKRRLPV